MAQYIVRLTEKTVREGTVTAQSADEARNRFIEQLKVGTEKS